MKKAGRTRSVRPAFLRRNGKKTLKNRCTFSGGCGMLYISQQARRASIHKEESYEEGHKEPDRAAAGAGHVPDAAAHAGVGSGERCEAAQLHGIVYQPAVRRYCGQRHVHQHSDGAHHLCGVGRGSGYRLSNHQGRRHRGAAQPDDRPPVDHRVQGQIGARHHRPEGLVAGGHLPCDRRWQQRRLPALAVQELRCRSDTGKVQRKLDGRL